MAINNYWGTVDQTPKWAQVAQSFKQGMDSQKQQKLAMAMEMIKSGAYQPTPTPQGQPTNMLQNVIQSLTGPKLGGQAMNVMGQNFQATPQNAGTTMGGLPLSEITSPLAGGRNAVYKVPSATYMSPDDVIAKYKSTEDKANKAGLDGENISVNAKGGVTITPQSGLQQKTDVSKKVAPSIFESLKRGNFTAYDKADPMIKDMVGKMASDAGVNLDKVRENYTTAMKLAQTAGSPQIIRFTSAENSLKQNLNVLDDLSNKYQRSNFMPTLSNKIKIAYDKETGDNGETYLKPRFTLGDTKDLANSQQQMAIRYLAQLNQSKDLLATVYQGGYSPHEEAFKMATDALNPLNGPKGQGVATNQIRIDMAIRRQGMRDALAGKSSDEDQVVDNETGKTMDGNEPTETQQVSQYQEGQTATNPQTKQKMVFKSGQWQKTQ